MADTNLVAASEQQAWEAKFFAEYVRENLFAPYMGTSPMQPIVLKEQLTKQRGDTINIPLITKLTNAGVTGDSTLEGNEEALGNYSHAVEVDQLRNAVRVGEFEQQKTTIDLLNASREMLRLWYMDKLRDDIIARMQSPNLDGTTTYAASDETAKDAWDAANEDRILFGAARANWSGDHSADLANVDSTTDVLDADMVSLAKRMAKSADPAIRPIRTKNGEEWFVLFCNSYAYRDLKTDATITQANREGWLRAAGRDANANPLFNDSNVIWDGVICVEVPEIPVIAGVGASNIDVAPNFLCGAQALGLAWAARPTFRTEEFDYGNMMGVATREIRGVEKLFFNSKQHGMLTIYASGVADG